MHKRDSARAIIFVDDKLLMVRSAKYGEYKFPGGGIEPGESHRAALIREVCEETGHTLIPNSIIEYGKTLIRSKSNNANEIFEQESFYYFCDVAPHATAAPTPDAGYEQEFGYAPIWVTPAEAIAANQQRTNLPQIPWVQRELAVLGELQAIMQLKMQLSIAFPALPIRTLSPLADGKAGTTFAVNDDLVLKISLGTDDSDSCLAMEYDVLSALRGKMDFPIPQPFFFAQLPDGRYALIESRVPGVPFSQEVYETFTQPEKDAIFIQLGSVTHQLHNVSTPHFSQISVYDPAANLADFHKYYTQDIKNVLTPTEQARIEQIAGDFQAAAASCPIPTVLCHGDLHFGNLNYDPQTKRLCGLFDFGLVCYNDPLNEFRYFWSDTVTIILRAYSGDLGDNIAARHLFYCMCNIIEEAHGELRAGPPGFFVDTLKRVIFQKPIQNIYT